MNTTPVETIRGRRGDCSEHSDLFASLCRAVNIPTRHCLGLFVQSQKAIYHNWVEVNLAGVWVPVDTTVNRVGLPAGYILTARDTTGKGDLTDRLPWAMKMNKLGLSVAGMVRGDYTIIPNQKKTYVAFRENWLANLLWGFALTKPEAWSGKIKLKSVVIASPDNKATIRCEAQNVSYRINKSELDSLVRTLKWTMKNFRRNEAKIVALGNYDTLLVDFTCVVNDREMRCRQFIIPRRDRSYRVSCWSDAGVFKAYEKDFESILSSLEL
jgi:hypothetical protein